MQTTIKIILAAAAVSLSGGLYAADSGVDRQQRTWTNDAGNTVEVVRARGINDEGTKFRGRKFRVTDADGNVLRQGRDRAFRTEDGARGRSHVRSRTRDDGSIVQRGHRVRSDGAGHVTRQRGRRVIR